MDKRRVVVTGMGAVTPCGINVKDFWNAMLSGKSGVTTFERICGQLFKTNKIQKMLNAWTDLLNLQ